MRVTELQNFTLGVAAQPQRDGFHVILEDKDTKEVLWFFVPREEASQIAEKLTGGIQIARAVP